MFDIALKLNEIGYFKGTVSTDRPYNLTLSTNNLRDSHDLYSHFRNMSENMLKKGFEILLFNKAKLIPLTVDIIGFISRSFSLKLKP